MARTPAFNTDTVLSAALETFWQRGYNGSSVQILLDAMELNRGSLYNSFGDKPTLFKTALDLYYQRITQMVLALLDHSPQPVQGILAVFELSLISLTELQRQKGCLLVNTVAELSETDPELAQHAHTLLQAVPAAFARALTRAREAGLWRNNDMEADAAANLLFNFITGLRITTRLQMDPEKTRLTVLQTLHMLGLETGAPRT